MSSELVHVPQNDEVTPNPPPKDNDTPTSPPNNDQPNQPNQQQRNDFINVTAINTANLKYNQLLVASLTIPVTEEFQRMRNEAIEETKGNPKEMLTHLRSLMRETKSWNQDVITNHCSAVKNYCQNRLRGRISLPTLIETSLVSTAKIMATPRIGRPKGRIEIEVPDADVFVKDVFVKCAQELHRSENIVLFSNKPSSQDQAKNGKNIKKIIKECVEEFILTSIPLEAILENIGSEDDLVEEAKQILENAKEDVSISHGKEEETKEEENDNEEEANEEEEENGMPPTSDVVPIKDEMQETDEEKRISINNGPDKELIKKREKKGFFKDSEHSFFSDSEEDDDDEDY